MADGWIPGEPISGSIERIYPGVIWEPEQPDTIREEIHFTELEKGVSETAAYAIEQSGGFKGNRKLYNINQGTMHARFSWWSVHIPPYEKIRLQNYPLQGDELADIYKPDSRYGKYVFHMDLGKLLSAYAKCCGCQPEIRVLGTYVYTREVMHAFVVVPSGDETFNEHSLVARTDADLRQVPLWVGDRTEYQMHHPFEINYSWKPFSVIQWKNYASFPKQRMWAHQAFAFFLEPLPQKMMRVPEVKDKTNWEERQQSEIDLVTSLRDEEFLPPDDFLHM